MYLLGTRSDRRGRHLYSWQMGREAEVATRLSGERGGGRIRIVPNEQGAALALHRFDVDTHEAARGLPRRAVTGATAQPATQCGGGDVKEPGGGVRMPEKRRQGRDRVIEP